MNQIITKELVDSAMSYEQFVYLTEQLLLEGRTTGPDQSESMVGYTRLNDRRMKRLSKTIKLNPSLVKKIEAIRKPLTWLVITEAWCGDAAQSIPVLAKMTGHNELLNMKLILRDENLEVMDAYLTNGSRAIPKLICLDANFQDVGTWGPRPAPIQKMVMDFKKISDGDYQSFSEKVQLWYARDKAVVLQQEILSLLDTWTA